MYKLTLAVSLCATVLFGTAGCYESPDVSMHEPGVYKGGRDPLIRTQGSPQQQQRLRDRFQLAEVDR